LDVSQRGAWNCSSVFIAEEPTLAESIRAKEFIVVDDEGHERATLGCRDGAVSLNMGRAGGPNVVLAVDDAGNARFEFRSGARSIRLLIDGQRAQIKLKNADAPQASCGLTLDAVGAWVYAESTPDIGLRLLSINGGQGAVVWLSEKGTDQGDPVVRTRCVRPNPREDSTSGWQAR